MTCRTMANTADYMVTVDSVLIFTSTSDMVGSQIPLNNRGCYLLLHRAKSEKIMLREMGSRVGVMGARWPET